MSFGAPAQAAVTRYDLWLAKRKDFTFNNAASAPRCVHGARRSDGSGFSAGAIALCAMCFQARRSA
jgi:hypothetical protein